MNCLESENMYVIIEGGGTTLKTPYREDYVAAGVYQSYASKLMNTEGAIVLPDSFEIEFKEGCNKMYKTELTIIKDSPSQMVMEPTKVTMLTEFSAEQWTKKIECSGHLPSFKFGTSVIYTHGVQAFIFKDVE